VIVIYAACLWPARFRLSAMPRPTAANIDHGSRHCWCGNQPRLRRSHLLPYTRTRTALATGIIDAAENNWPSCVASSHYSVAPYFALTEHTMTPDVLIMSMKAWSSLSPTDQNIFRNAARDSSIFLRGQWKNWEASFRKQALDLGVTVIEIDRKPLEAALTGLYTKVLTDSHSRHLVESIQKDQ